jgi:hypothetical protein
MEVVACGEEHFCNGALRVEKYNFSARRCSNRAIRVGIDISSAAFFFPWNLPVSSTRDGCACLECWTRLSYHHKVWHLQQARSQIWRLLAGCINFRVSQMVDYDSGTVDSVTAANLETAIWSSGVCIGGTGARCHQAEPGSDTTGVLPRPTSTIVFLAWYAASIKWLVLARSTRMQATATASAPCSCMQSIGELLLLLHPGRRWINLRVPAAHPC